MTTKTNKEMIQEATAKLVADYLETPAGSEGATPEKVAELKARACRKLKLKENE